MSGEERVMMSARIPKTLKRLVDADERPNQEVLESAIVEEFGGERVAAVDKRIEKKRNHIEAAMEEKGAIDDEIETYRQEIQELEEQREKLSEENSANQEEWYRKVRMVPRETDHPIVQEAAEELDMTPADVLTEAYDE